MRRASSYARSKCRRPSYCYTHDAAVMFFIVSFFWGGRGLKVSGFFWRRSPPSSGNSTVTSSPRLIKVLHKCIAHTNIRTLLNTTTANRKKGQKNALVCTHRRVLPFCLVLPLARRRKMTSQCPWLRTSRDQKPENR